MARAKTSVARTDRYTHGKKVPSTKTKSGFRIDKSQPRDEDDRLFCKKGDSYFKWQFKGGSPQFSLTPPKQSQLTQNPFYGALYSIGEELEELDPKDYMDEPTSLEVYKEEVLSQIQEMLDELEEKQGNMECAGLENVPSYEIVSERLDAVQNWLDEMENIDCELDFETIREEVDSDMEEDTEEERDAEYDNRVLSLIEEKTIEMSECTCEA